jgi:hypothetical protein
MHGSLTLSPLSVCHKMHATRVYSHISWRACRGECADSFHADAAELVELRARQRTFGGAYSRTALGCLGYALTILKLFDRRFYQSMFHLLIRYSVLGGRRLIYCYLL